MKPDYFFKRRLSFTFAFNGMRYALATQQNLVIHLIATIVVIVLSVYLSLQPIEWAVITLTIAIVWVAELVNTAIEKTVDLVTQEHHPLAKIAKDLAAAAVLMSALSSIIVGLIIFLPKILSRL